MRTAKDRSSSIGGRYNVIQYHLKPTFNTRQPHLNTLWMLHSGSSPQGTIMAPQQDDRHARGYRYSTHMYMYFKWAWVYLAACFLFWFVFFSSFFYFEFSSHCARLIIIVGSSSRHDHNRRWTLFWVWCEPTTMIVDRK